MEVPTMLVRHPRTSAPRKALRSSRTAFTLLEVLVVVAIIVMLAGVGGYYLLQRYEDAKVSRAKIDCEQLAAAADTYRLNNGQYPTSIEQLTQTQPNGSSAIVPPDKITDPWGKPYRIDPNGAHNQGLKADVYTTTPKGATIGNFRN
jgi:general secretion pathway protein G